jgi:hypothetical protein
MKLSINSFKKNYINLAVLSAFVISITGLLFYKIGNLVIAYGPTENRIAHSNYGFSYVLHHIFNLPIEFIRMLVFHIFPNHVYSITRLPNIILGMICILLFSYIILQWHGKRTAILSAIFFISNSWFLHVSRLASNDIMYGYAVLGIVFANIILKKYKTSQYALWVVSFIYGTIITIPGMIWLLLVNIYFIKDDYLISWQHQTKFYKKVIALLLVFVNIPLIILSILYQGGTLAYFGLPEKLGSITLIFKHLIAAPVHLLIRGPEYPELWLGRQPILSILLLISFVLGMYFYINHKDAVRSKMLITLLISSLLLVGLNGTVSLTAPIFITFLIAATGITFYLKNGYQCFQLTLLLEALALGFC